MSLSRLVHDPRSEIDLHFVLFTDPHSNAQSKKMKTRAEEGIPDLSLSLAFDSSSSTRANPPKGSVNATFEDRKPQVKVEWAMLGELKVGHDDDVDEASNYEADGENTARTANATPMEEPWSKLSSRRFRCQWRLRERMPLLCWLSLRFQVWIRFGPQAQTFFDITPIESRLCFFRA